MRVFHVGASRVDRFVPRPSPSWSSRPGESLVWAVDEEHLWLRLLPRECHRVHATRAPSTTVPDAALLGAAERVVWLTPRGLSLSLRSTLVVHELPRDGFTVEDASAGYLVRSTAATPLAVETVAPLAALRARRVEVRTTDDLDAVVARVTASTLDWSVIRAPGSAA